MLHNTQNVLNKSEGWCLTIVYGKFLSAHNHISFRPSGFITSNKALHLMWKIENDIKRWKCQQDPQNRNVLTKVCLVHKFSFFQPISINVPQTKEQKQQNLFLKAPKRTTWFGHKYFDMKEYKLKVVLYNDGNPV